MNQYKEPSNLGTGIMLVTSISLMCVTATSTNSFLEQWRFIHPAVSLSVATILGFTTAFMTVWGFRRFASYLRMRKNDKYLSSLIHHKTNLVVDDSFAEIDTNNPMKSVLW